MNVTGLFVLQLPLGTVGFPGICLGGSSVARCPPPVFTAVTESGGGRSFMLARSVYMGLG